MRKYKRCIQTSLINKRSPDFRTRYLMPHTMEGTNTSSDEYSCELQGTVSTLRSKIDNAGTRKHRTDQWVSYIENVVLYLELFLRSDSYI